MIAGYAAPIRGPVRGRTGLSKSRGLQASVLFSPLSHPAPSTFLLSPPQPECENSFAWPEFRSRRRGTLAMEANQL